MEIENKKRKDTGSRHNYPARRKKRTFTVKKNGGKYYSLTKRKLHEDKLKLEGYAPVYTSIYTITYHKSRNSRYQYIDVFCVNNNQFFKITKIVAHILGYKLYRTWVGTLNTAFWGKDCMRFRTYVEQSKMYKKDIIQNEINFVKDLSMRMFNTENGYRHESLLMMGSEYERKIEEIKTHTKKSYIAKSI